ncbi:MAG: YqhA family protein, partial [Gloeomargarita sp. DG02_5_bins_242]
MIQRLFTFSRRMVIVAVVCSLIASMLVLLIGMVETIDVVYTLASDWSKLSGKKVMIPLVEVTDLFLVGTVFY